MPEIMKILIKVSIQLILELALIWLINITIYN